MSDDEKPSEPTTKEIPAVSPVEVMLARMDKKVDKIGLNIDLLAGQVDSLQNWRGDVELRLKSNSMRASSASMVDATHEARIAEEAQRRIALEKQIADTHALALSTSAETQAQTLIMTKLLAFAETPMAKRIGYAAGALLLAALTAATGYLAHGGH